MSALAARPEVGIPAGGRHGTYGKRRLGGGDENTGSDFASDGQGITWWQAANIIGISERQMRRWHRRYEKWGYDGLWDRRRGGLSPRRVPLETAQEVLRLYGEKCFDFNVSHCHEKLREQHGIGLSYTWVKLALQGAGLVRKRRRHGTHRQRRVRRPLPGMLLHLDDSTHAWIADHRRYDLLVVLDDATSKIYYAQLVEQESTRTVLEALREVVRRQGVSCALYSDRASHFFETPKAGGKIDPQRVTQVGRALRELGIGMIPAYSPQARGRSERSFGTWQGRLPQELRLRGITTLEEANRFLHEEYMAGFNPRFRVAAAQPGSAFLRLQGQDLERIFSVPQERVVNRDNTVQIGNRILQIEKTPWRDTLAGCRVLVYEYLDGTLSGGYGPHVVGSFNAEGMPLLETIPRRRKAVGKPLLGNPKAGFPLRLEIPQKERDAHFPTATATGSLT
jgi:transposase